MNEECSICYEYKKLKRFSNHCIHKFCRRCIKTKKKNDIRCYCPLCRTFVGTIIDPYKFRKDAYKIEEKLYTCLKELGDYNQKCRAENCTNEGLELSIIGNYYVLICKDCKNKYNNRRCYCNDNFIIGNVEED